MLHSFANLYCIPRESPIETKGQDDRLLAQGSKMNEDVPIPSKAFFFQDQQELERVVEHVVPNLSGRSHSRIWHAGVAVGPEPYMLAMMFAERMGGLAFNGLRIDATAVENAGQFIQQAEAARYSQEIRSRVVYRPHDLLSLAEIGHRYSLVVCKNVLLHFPRRERVEVLRMFHRALALGGIFATDPTHEMPRELVPLFQRVIPNAALYRKVDGADTDDEVKEERSCVSPDLVRGRRRFGGALLLEAA